MFKITSNSGGRALSLPFNRCNIAAKFPTRTSAVAAEIRNGRADREIGIAALFLLCALALPQGAAATTAGAYSALKGVFYLSEPGRGGEPPTQVKILGSKSHWLPVLGAGSFQFGLYDKQTGTFYFRLEGSTGALTQKIRFDGFNSKWLPVAGDWDGDRAYGVGLYDPQTGTFYLKNKLTNGPADIVARLGGTTGTWKPLVGDWNGDGITTIGAYNPGNGRFYLRNTNTSGSAELTMQIQGLSTSLRPVAADWNNDGRWSPGLYDPATRYFYWRNILNTGPQQGRLKLTGTEAAAVPLARSISVTEPTPSVTEVGAPSGSAVKATISAAGGTLRSADNRLRLSIPAGALAADRQITIQPITNHAHGGKGKAYRLLPDGQTFLKPVKLTFSYTDQDLNGTAASAFGGAFQTREGYWRWLGKPVVNTTAKTVTIATTHFTDFSFVQGLNLRPGVAKVMVNGRIDLAVKDCYPYRGPDPDPNDPYPVGLGYDCDSAYSDAATLVPVNEWAVNGVAGGDSELGTVGVTADNGFIATYRAPATKPVPATVDVTARLAMDGTTLLFSHITILDEVKAYTGTVYFDQYQDTPRQVIISSKADVTWKQYDVPDPVDNARHYLPSGNIIADFKFPECDHRRVTIPIRTGTANMPEGDLLVFSKTDAQFPKNYAFHLGGEDIDITLTCYLDYPENKRPYNLVLTGAMVNVMGSSCPANGNTSGGMLSYADEMNLLGAVVCIEPPTNVFWSFEGTVLQR